MTMDDLLRRAARQSGISIRKNVLGGRPCVKGTDISVAAVLDLLRTGYTHEGILVKFPKLTKEGLKSALRFAVLVMER